MMFQNPTAFLPLAQVLNLQLEAQFMSRDFDLWDYQLGVTLDFSRPGEPTDMPYIAESCRRNQPASAKKP